MTADLVDRTKQMLAQGRAGEAALLLQAALPSDNPSIHTLLGYALYQSNRLADAERTLQAALKAFPGDPTLHEAAARMRWLNGAGDSFADAFIAASEAEPGNLALRYRCVDLLRLAGRFDMAERMLRQALALHPGDIATKVFLGVLLDETGRFDESAARLAETVSAAPGEPMLRLNLAHVLMRMNRPDQAKPEIADVRRAFPMMQLAISYEAILLRQLADPRYAWLCDYDRHLRVYDIEPPKGFATVADFNAALGDHLRGLHEAHAHPLEQSLRGGSQTSQNLVHTADPLLQTYFEALDAPIRDYIAGLGPDRTHPMEQRKSKAHALSGCWSVLLRANGFHVNHTHPHGWISSSYYVSLPPQMGEQRHEGWIKFGEPRWPMPGVSVERTIQPQEGRLVLFPSYFWHGTIPFGSGTRLTAPFDVVPQ